MKKTMIFILVLPLIANASCPVSNECPEKEIICLENEFMGDDGKCYSCNIDKSISISCIGFEQLEKICPNRVREFCQYSALKCRDAYEYAGNYCRIKCDEGYTRNKEWKCCKDDVCIFNTTEW